LLLIIFFSFSLSIADAYLAFRHAEGFRHYCHFMSCLQYFAPLLLSHYFADITPVTLSLRLAPLAFDGH